jgi:hypothetical protein
MNEMAYLEKQKTESGQATVETILLIAIAVVLILGLIKEFYRPFGTWVNAYMTGYLECLLDVGELPTFGSSSTNGKCAEKYKNGALGTMTGLNVGSGTGGKGGSGGNGSGSGGSSGGSGNNSGSNGSGAGGKNGSGGNSSANGGNTRGGKNGSGGIQGGLIGSNGDSANGAGGNGSGDSDEFGDGGAGNRRSSTRGNRRSFLIAGSTGTDSRNSSSEPIVEKLPETKYQKSGSATSFSYSVGQRTESVPTTGYMPMEREKIRRREEASFSVPASEDAHTESQKSERFKMVPVERKVASAVDDSGWTFAEYLKYAVIIAIVLAIGLFLGGQILQITKSMEKK